MNHAQDRIDGRERATSVLVVEDDYISLEIITALFEKAGMKVHAASSGEAALTILRDRGATIDWLFTDVRLPGILDGWVVAEEYRLRHPERPVIYASAARHRPQRAVSGSIFVEKPFSPDQILRLAEMMADALADHDVVADASREHTALPSAPFFRA